MANPLKRPATYEDLRAIPENHIGEILNGELFTQPRPASLHANVGSLLTTLLSGPFRLGRGGPGGWLILYEPELHLADDILVPDLAGWRRERMAELPDVAAFDLAPDWVCEIASRRTVKRDRTTKMEIYARERVPFVWRVDPDAMTLEAFRLEGALYVRLGAWADESTTKIPPFDAIELDVAMLWTR